MRPQLLRGPRLPVAALLLGLAPATGLGAQSDPLAQMSLDSLLSVPVHSAARHAQTMDQAPASVTILTREDIARYGYRTLPEALQRVRGISMSDDRTYSYIGIRGIGRPGDYNSRVLIMLDGHVVNEAIYGGAYVGQELGVSLSEVERIEIVRGPGSALFGTGAMLAVIDVITVRPSGTPGASLAIEGGSDMYRHAEASASGRIADRMDVRVSGRIGESDGRNVYFPDFDDPETNFGVAEDLDWERWASARVVARGEHLSVRARTSIRRKAFPTAAFFIDFNHPDARSDDGFSAVDVRYERSVRPDLALGLRSTFDHYRYRGTYPYEGEYHDASDGHTWGAEVHAIWDPRPDNRVTAGLAFQRSSRADYRSFFENELLWEGDFPWHVASVFVQDEMHLAPWISLTAGVRLDDYSFEGAFLTPRAAVVVRPNEGTVLKAIYGEAYRAPNVYERHYENEDESKANPDIVREHVRSLELVAERRLARTLYGTLSLYHNRVADLIDAELDPEDGLFWFVNSGRARARGVEAELDLRLPSGVSGYANHAIQDARDGDGMWLSNAPRHVGRAGLSAPVHQMARLSSEVRWETGRGTFQGTRTDGGAVVRLIGLLDPSPRLRITMVVDNLFDTALATPGSWEHPMAEIPNRGRSLRLRAGLTF